MSRPDLSCDDISAATADRVLLRYQLGVSDAHVVGHRAETAVDALAHHVQHPERRSAGGERGGDERSIRRAVACRRRPSRHRALRRCRQAPNDPAKTVRSWSSCHVGVIELVERPVDQRPEALVPGRHAGRRGVQLVEAFFEIGEQLGERARRELGCGHLDRQRQPVEAPDGAGDRLVVVIVQARHRPRRHDRAAGSGRARTHSSAARGLTARTCSPSTARRSRLVTTTRIATAPGGEQFDDVSGGGGHVLGVVDHRPPCRGRRRSPAHVRSTCDR